MAMQVEHKTEKGTILFVKVPDDYCYYPSTFSISQSEPLELGLCDVNGEGKGTMTLPFGNWQLIGLTSEITEEQAKMILTKSGGPWSAYKDYTSNNNWFASALWSFKSLMQHLQVYEINPIRNRPEDFQDGKYLKRLGEWQQAQSRRGKWVVLFKPEI